MKANIAVVDKCNYLNSLVEGPVAKTIQGHYFNEGSYQSAVRLLQDEYAGKPRQIIIFYMQELLKMSPYVYFSLW